MNFFFSCKNLGPEKKVTNGIYQSNTAVKNLIEIWNGYLYMKKDGR